MKTDVLDKLSLPYNSLATSSGRILFLDGWRGTAIAAVLLGHFVPVPGSDLGRMGVELFFVLSGRLMAQILIEHRPSLGKFYWRRMSRVLPALLVFVAFVFAVSNVTPIAPSPREYASVLTFWSNYLFAFTEREPVFGHTWSLAIEEHSYILLGLVALLASRNRSTAAVIALVMALLCWYRAWALTYQDDLDYYQVFWRTDVRAASIFIGFSLYLVRPQTLLERMGVTLGSADRIATLSFAVGAILFIDVFPDLIKYTLGTTLFALAMIIGQSVTDNTTRSVSGIMCSKIMLWLGAVSYSTYLYQQFFHVIKKEFPPYLYPLWIIPAIIVGYFSYRYVEGPSRKFLNRIVEKRPLKAESLPIRAD